MQKVFKARPIVPIMGTVLLSLGCFPLVPALNEIGWKDEVAGGGLVLLALILVLFEGRPVITIIGQMIRFSKGHLNVVSVSADEIRSLEAEIGIKGKYLRYEMITSYSRGPKMREFRFPVKAFPPKVLKSAIEYILRLNPKIELRDGIESILTMERNPVFNHLKRKIKASNK